MKALFRISQRNQVHWRRGREVLARVEHAHDKRNEQTLLGEMDDKSTRKYAGSSSHLSCFHLLNWYDC